MIVIVYYYTKTAWLVSALCPVRRNWSSQPMSVSLAVINACLACPSNKSPHWLLTVCSAKQHRNNSSPVQSHIRLNTITYRQISIRMYIDRCTYVCMYVCIEVRLFMISLYEYGDCLSFQWNCHALAICYSCCHTVSEWRCRTRYSLLIDNSFVCCCFCCILTGILRMEMIYSLAEWEGKPKGRCVA